MALRGGETRRERDLPSLPAGSPPVFSSKGPRLAQHGKIRFQPVQGFDFVRQNPPDGLVEFLSPETIRAENGEASLRERRRNGKPGSRDG